MARGLIACTAGAGACVVSDEGLRRSVRVFGFCAGAGTAFAIADIQASDQFERDAERASLHQRFAPDALELVLELRGFYLKAAQTLAVTGLLPLPYERAFSAVLLEADAAAATSALARPSARVREIVAAELGCPLEEVFSNWNDAPLAAASIGQVHCATLHSGERVAVKVMVDATAERLFRLDLRVARLLLGIAGGHWAGAARGILDGLAFSFECELDYQKEAVALRRCHENLQQRAENFQHWLRVPLPIDAAHPSAPHVRPSGGEGGRRSLCSRRVLTMEALEGGAPLATKIVQLMERWASQRGLTLAQLRSAHKAELEDTQRLGALLGTAPPSKAEAALATALAHATDAAANTARLAFNLSLTGPHNPLGSRSGAARPLAFKWSGQPCELLSGPKIFALLCDAHGHQVFADGYFNSDPHAGNCLVLEDGKLGLVDYGAAASLSVPQRRAFAQLIVALADDDDEAVLEACACDDLGFASLRDDRTYVLARALMCFHRGQHLDDLQQRAGVPPEVGAEELHGWLQSRDSLVKFEPHLFQLQRCVLALLAIARQMGASNVSIAHMWRPHAARFLAAHSGSGDDALPVDLPSQSQ